MGCARKSAFWYDDVGTESTEIFPYLSLCSRISQLDVAAHEKESNSSAYAGRGRWILCFLCIWNRNMIRTSNDWIRGNAGRAMIIQTLSGATRVHSLNSRDCSLTRCARLGFQAQSICCVYWKNCIRLLRCCIVFYIYFLFEAKKNFSEFHTVENIEYLQRAKKRSTLSEVGKRSLAGAGLKGRNENGESSEFRSPIEPGILIRKCMLLPFAFPPLQPVAPRHHNRFLPAPLLAIANRPSRPFFIKGNP